MQVKRGTKIFLYSLEDGVNQWRSGIRKYSLRDSELRHDHSPPLIRRRRKATFASSRHPFPPPATTSGDQKRPPILPPFSPPPSPPPQQVVITNFVPPEEVSTVERRAQWNEEASAWLIPRLELAGNSLLRMRRPVSAVGLPRPETEYARHRKGYDSNTRSV